MSTEKTIHGTGPAGEAARRHPAGQTADGTAPSLPSLEAKWTPGPWVVETPRDRDDADRDWSEKHPYGAAVRSHWEPPRNAVVGYEVCIMSGMSHETLPNARLIAAAPELYAALEAFVEGEPKPYPPGSLDARLARGRERWVRACAALAKARGEKPDDEQQR